MQKRTIGGVELQRSSGNVFADLGLPDAENLKIKSGLVFEIRKGMRNQRLTQQVAANRMGITQAKLSAMMRGDFDNLPESELAECLKRLHPGPAFAGLSEIHPGEILLEDFLNPSGITVDQFAQEIGVAAVDIEELTTGSRAMTADLAERIGRHFGMAPAFWLNLQAEFNRRTKGD